MLKLVVPIKQVVTLDEDIELGDSPPWIETDSLETELNEWDRFSVEAAVQIKEAHGDAEVVVISVGGEQVEEAIVDSLASGADRGLRISNEGLGDDPLEVAFVLSAAVAREQPDLVLCGVQSSDAASGATGIALAARLGLPHVAVVRGLDFRPGERRVRVDRELEGGLVEELELPTPALLTVQTGANAPRYATLRAIKQAKNKPLDVVTISDLALGDAAVAQSRGARLTGYTVPERAAGAQMLDGDADAVANRISAIISDKLGDTRGVTA